MAGDPEWLVRAIAEGRAAVGPTPRLPPAGAPEPKSAANTVHPADGIPVTRLAIEFELPVTLKSEANAGGRLKDKIARKSVVKAAVRAALELAKPPPLPVVVTVTRLGSHPLDELDNLPRACKSVVDTVAEWLGITDGPRDKRARWRVRQQPAWVGGGGVRVRIEHRG